MTRRLCLITGASAGIGAAIARTWAGHGFDVALTARRTDRLEDLAAEIRQNAGVETLTIAADLSDPQAPDAILDEIAAHGRQVDALVNNAGYGTRGTYAEMDWDECQDFLQVLVTSVCELTRKTVPGMIDRKYGRIVNVASVAGMMPGTPGAVLYSPAKSFLIRYSEGLHNELRATGVHVSALCPGLTFSEFHDVTGSREQITKSTPEWAWSTAEEVAASAYEAAEANRPICVPGPHNIAAATLLKLLPDEWVMAFIRSRFGRQNWL